MRPEENIEKIIKKFDIYVNPTKDQEIFDDLREAQAKSKQSKPGISTIGIRRIIMKSKITKLAAVAVIIFVATLSINLLDNSITTAYALEQTIQAYNTTNSFHFKYYSSLQDQNKGLRKEAWIEYDESGNIGNVRVNYSWPKKDMVLFWKDGKALQWIKESKWITYIGEKDFSDKILYFGQRYNPKGAIQYLYERQTNGEITIEIEEPSDKAEPIAITAYYPPNTYLIGKDISAMREIFFVDQDTKLVTEVEIYELLNDEYMGRGVWRYYDYNKPFDEAIFSIENEIPDDIFKLYRYGVKDAGLEQGDLNEKQIVTEVVSQFLEALINEDYANAGHLFGGMPTDEAEEKFGELNIIQIISIDEPVEAKDLPTGYRASCSVMINRDGKIVQWQPQSPFIRKLNQTDRWIISGGF